ncbi:MAG: hypothetical protein Q9174_003203 [Haloplaca sp. 1 TL-2023]
MDDSSDEETMVVERESQTSLTVEAPIHDNSDTEDAEDTSDYIELIRSRLQDRRLQSANQSSLQDQRDQQQLIEQLQAAAGRAIEEFQEMQDEVLDEMQRARQLLADSEIPDMYHIFQERDEGQELMVPRFAEGGEDDVAGVDVGSEADAEFETQSLQSWEGR